MGITLLTREAFDRQRARGQAVERNEGRVAAVVSVTLGLGQLGLIRWLEAHLERGRAVAIEGAVFVAYIVLVGWLLWRVQRRLRATRVACPHCGAVLQGISERIVVATGRCDQCGGQVLEDAP